MAMVKSVLLDGVSSVTELGTFLETVPNFRESVVVKRDTISTVISKLYTLCFCHHPFPKNWDELDTSDHEFQDFLHTILTVAKTQRERIEALSEDGGLL